MSRRATKTSAESVRDGDANRKPAEPVDVSETGNVGDVARTNVGTFADTIASAWKTLDEQETAGRVAIVLRDWRDPWARDVMLQYR